MTRYKISFQGEAYFFSVTYCLPVQNEHCFDELDADDCAAEADIGPVVSCP